MNADQLASVLGVLADLLEGDRGPRPPRSKLERYELRASCPDCRVGVSVPVEIYLAFPELTAEERLRGEAVSSRQQRVRERMDRAARQRVADALKAHRDQGHRVSEVQRVDVP